MSFASEVRRELTNLEIENEDVKKAIILGMLQNSTEIVLSSKGPKLKIKSHLLGVIKMISSYLRKKYQTDEEYSTKENNPLNEFRYYYLEITNNTRKIIDDFKLLYYDDLNIEVLNLKTIDEKNAFVRGLFITHGSVSDPRRSTYHLEILCTKYEIAKIAQEILIESGIVSSILQKKNNYLLYIKKSEDISQTLVLLGAMQGMFNFEDSRIYRDFKNMANRVTNCDIANEKKCQAASKRQQDAIKFIKEKNKFHDMSIRLQSIANLRLMYPDSSNEELSEYSSNVFGKTLSKSGISHCLKALVEYAESLKNTKNK